MRFPSSPKAAIGIVSVYNPKSIMPFAREIRENASGPGRSPAPRQHSRTADQLSEFRTDSRGCHRTPSAAACCSAKHDVLTQTSPRRHDL
jgi:hypothetical protein